ncbi:DUF4065 domain-containing protein [Clostridium perfringens]|uniref:Panacea domain-containing protein n=1 Tax=Clostridium perfringens TaxID=1502 RepID=UPI001CAFE887|nr:type II toxin-antitoxin system antitoxin SocA domain-containing protein [Clostridium perfringens]MDU2662522.1 DUF4065 domain-containing protein [Clostridioides difficile]STB14684.1 putative phage-associated protein [Clostridium novyi]MCX0359194.1 DUF4065 domain-containing protein [Clostridium perfringens]MCX0406820.1 DUF4065 domain-containing protein [Clostridium perfringens]MCX0419477.1 DUF4065 domain-containing protein [Clostridium perfringens]
MYRVVDVANYIINYSHEIGGSLTNLKLQKILYYVDAAFLVDTGSACFYEDFEHWRHGPVVPEIYSKYRKYLNSPIEEQQEDSNISNEDREIINRVIEGNIKKDPWELVKRTHEEDPWVNTTTNEIITKNSIKQFFMDNNINRIYGE